MAHIKVVITLTMPVTANEGEEEKLAENSGNLAAIVPEYVKKKMAKDLYEMFEDSGVSDLKLTATYYEGDGNSHLGKGVK